MRKHGSLSALIAGIFRGTPLRALLASALVLLSSAAAGQPDQRGFIDEHGRQHPGFSFRFTDEPQLQRAIRAQERELDNLLRRRGVVGTAIGWDDAGNPVIRVFSAGASGLPRTIDGFAVRLEETGQVYALRYACRQDNPNVAFDCPDTATPGAGSTGTRGRHRPVPNGVSIGHESATAGTVSCLVTQGCHVLVLSNNHVIANENIANVGDLVLQPGPYDGGIYPTDAVGTLFDWVDIVMDVAANNRVDAGIALVNGEDFTNMTMPDGYGVPKSSWLAPEAGMNVMKFGRTTRYTEGIITGINAVVYVNYGTCCARFIDQVVVEPAPGYADFAKAGDSGSLVVMLGGPDTRRPVALVFALGENGAIFANPIDDVVNELNIDILGD